MTPRPDLTVRSHAIGMEAEETLLAETILKWRSLGPPAAWQAIYDMLDWWFESRGMDPENQRVDRTHIETHPVPWLEAESALDG